MVIVFKKSFFCWGFPIKIAFFIGMVVFSGVSYARKTSRHIVHKAHLSSAWYSHNKAELEKSLHNYFEISNRDFSIKVDPNKVFSLIVPHAGHYFSGLCAASAYQAITKGFVKNRIVKNDFFKRVIILAPSHARGFKGIALPGYDVYRTVLGDIDVDKKAIGKLENKLYKIVPKVHASEHSVEVELPFLQFCLDNFSIVPLIVGQLDDKNYDAVVKELEKIVDNKTLIVVSSDFVHYGSRFGYTPFKNNLLRNINRINDLSIRAISDISVTDFDKMLAKTKATICGRNAIKILLKLAQKRGPLECRLASYYSSPQLQEACQGNKIVVKKLFNNVSDEKARDGVSYAGLVLTSEKLDSQGSNSLTGYEKLALLQLARDVITNDLNKGTPSFVDEKLLYPVISSGLKQEAGAFVTLNTKSGKLRGCIGRILASGRSGANPLFMTVASMAKSAAFDDSRFSPVKKEELADLVIDITVLTPPKKIDSYKDIKLGLHGIILKKRLPTTKGFNQFGYTKQAVFLPQVPGSFGWDLVTTLEHLSVKAGLKKDEYKTCEYEVFEGFEFKEH